MNYIQLDDNDIIICTQMSSDEIISTKVIKVENDLVAYQGYKWDRVNNCIDKSYTPIVETNTQDFVLPQKTEIQVLQEEVADIKSKVDTILELLQGGE